MNILVNVANYPVPPAKAEEIDLVHWHQSFAAGPLAMFMLARAVLPHMKAAGGGRIVNFGSELSENPRTDRAVYAAAKGAVRSLTKALAWEWGTYNICVNTVWPSAVTSSWQKAWVTGQTIAANGGWTMW